MKKTESRLVRHQTGEEMHAILNAPNPSIWDGIRDRAMLRLRRSKPGKLRTGLRFDQPLSSFGRLLG